MSRQVVARPHQLLARETIINNQCSNNAFSQCLQCSDTVGWASGRASGLWVWLFVWSDVQVVAYDPADATASQNPRSLASVESRLVLPFWYRLTQVVRENRQTDRQTDRQTHRPRYICSSGPHLCTPCMQCGLIHRVK